MGKTAEILGHEVALQIRDEFNRQRAKADRDAADALLDILNTMASPTKPPDVLEDSVRAFKRAGLREGLPPATIRSTLADLVATSADRVLFDSLKQVIPVGRERLKP